MGSGEGFEASHDDNPQRREHPNVGDKHQAATTRPGPTGSAASTTARAKLWLSHPGSTARESTPPQQQAQMVQSGASGGVQTITVNQQQPQVIQLQLQQQQQAQPQQQQQQQAQPHHQQPGAAAVPPG